MSHDESHLDERLWPRGFDGHRRAQVALGLRLTPAERLRWLDEAMETLRRWQGQALWAGRAERPTAPGDGDGQLR